MRPALLLVDIQLDYFPKGRMEVEGAVEASRNARELLQAFREKKLPIVHIRHIMARPNATFLLPDTEGVDIHENVTPLSGETVLIKHFPNSFRETALDEHLNSLGVEEVVICGMMSHMCIDTTTRAAFDLGYRCVVAHDACATRSLAFGGVTIPASHVHGAYMAALGAVFAKVSYVQEVIGEIW